MPAAMLHAPTPAFRMAVGYSSAVYTGIIVLPALIVNLPIISSAIFSGWFCGICESTMATQQHAKPAEMKVAQNDHFFPTFRMMKIASAMAGISTKPASACAPHEHRLKMIDYSQNL